MLREVGKWIVGSRLWDGRKKVDRGKTRGRKRLSQVTARELREFARRKIRRFTISVV